MVKQKRQGMEGQGTAIKRYGNSTALRVVLRSACFSRKKRQETGTDTEKLRRQQNTTDSGAVLFLIRKGPLGG